MKNIYQIGFGLIGKTMAQDLSKNFHVHVVDINPNAFINLNNPNIIPSSFDVTKRSDLAEWLNGADLVLLAVPGFLGYKILEMLIELELNVIDISFSPENLLELDKKAKNKGVTVIIDAGLAPGLPNLFLGHYYKENNIDSFSYYVGGLPMNPKPPFKYKAPFSPIDVIEEYTREVTQKVNGQLIKRQALTDIEERHYNNIGNLEAFNTDGLRSLIFTMKDIPNLKEKTLRFCGHANLIIEMKNKGLFNKKSIESTSQKLIEEWKLDVNEKEFTVLEIFISSADKNTRIFLYDEFDNDSKTTSMARCTGFTATGCVNLFNNEKNDFEFQGVVPLEVLGQNKNYFNFLIQYLNDRKIKFDISQTSLV